MSLCLVRTRLASAVARSAPVPLYLSLQRRAFSTSRFAMALTFNKYPFLARLGLSEDNAGVFNGQFVKGEGEVFTSINPATNEQIARVTTGTPAQLESCIQAMDRAKPKFSSLPLPVRGELVRQLGEALRAKKADLGALVSLEMGKISAEGLGEVQEAIDICDYAVGLSRTLNGSIIPSSVRAIS